ncbi:hypothetical protein LOK49_LG02G04074 [Camellia lanceoleosa]|uniref:Uncharacterized protein n=1 Tax=Camellia lanceoleosa TaxID=1840588 RepID=A0ACC0IP93_9ERIC|nr:hypothetical protein LOK49_LG02G04074 [Camellia lanceoleosa]
MIKKIKAKTRKTTEISDYEHGGNKVKVEKGKEHKDETISNKYAVAQLLALEDKYKLQILWKEKQTESRYDNCVFINEITSLVKGNDISSCTIDTYAEILEKNHKYRILVMELSTMTSLSYCQVYIGYFDPDSLRSGLPKAVSSLEWAILEGKGKEDLVDPIKEQFVELLMIWLRMILRRSPLRIFWDMLLKAYQIGKGN